MFISVDDQVTALVALLNNVSALVKNYDAHPEALDTRGLPCTITAPGPATYEQAQRGAGYVRVTRVFKIKVYVKPLELGREHQAEDELRPFLTRIIDELAQHPRVMVGRRAFELTLDRGGDSGPSILAYNGKDYAGTIITVNAISEAVVTIVR